MTQPAYILSRSEDHYGAFYFVVVNGRDAGIVRKTSANGPFRWEATTKSGKRICTGSTRKEVADTVASRATKEA